MDNYGDGHIWFQWIYDAFKVNITLKSWTLTIYFYILSDPSFHQFNNYIRWFWNRNPLLILGIFVAYLIGKAIWVQMDVGGEFRHGAVSTVGSFLSFYFFPQLDAWNSLWRFFCPHTLAIHKVVMRFFYFLFKYKILFYNAKMILFTKLEVLVLW